MKIHAFKVERSKDSSDLENVLTQIKSEPGLDKRIRLINQIELRAESIDDNDGLWLLDFVRIRTNHGPGKVGRESQIEGFNFNDGEGFGEETAALFDPKSNYILIQYNHFGVRDSAIANYLSKYDGRKNNDYLFKPKFDQDVERRLQKQKIMKKITFTIDVTKMTDQDREAGYALKDAIDFGRIGGGDKIKIEISAQRDRDLGLAEKAIEYLNSLRKILNQNQEAISKLEVSGKENRDSLTEVIDLIGHRLFVEFNDLRLGNDLRFSRDDRWNALIRANNKWIDVLT